MTTIDRRRQLGQKRAVELASGELRLHTARIEADDAGAQAGGYHLRGEGCRIALPQGKQGCEPRPRQLRLAVGAVVTTLLWG